MGFVNKVGMEAAVRGPRLRKRLKCPEALPGMEARGDPCWAPDPPPCRGGLLGLQPLPWRPKAHPAGHPLMALWCSIPSLRTPGRPLTTAQLRPPGHPAPPGSQPPTPVLSHPCVTPVLRGSPQNISSHHRKPVGVRTVRPNRPPAPLAPSALFPQPCSRLCPPLPEAPAWRALPSLCLTEDLQARDGFPSALWGTWGPCLRGHPACSRVWAPSPLWMPPRVWPQDPLPSPPCPLLVPPSSNPDRGAFCLASDHPLAPDRQVLTTRTMWRVCPSRPSPHPPSRSLQPTLGALAGGGVGPTVPRAWLHLLT